MSKNLEVLNHDHAVVLMATIYAVLPLILIQSTGKQSWLDMLLISEKIFARLIKIVYKRKI